VSRKNRSWLGMALAVVMLPPVAWGLADPDAVRAHFVPYSDFRRLADRLFASPSFANADSERLASMIKEAEARVAVLFDGYTANPRIIVAADPESANRYSFNLHATIHPTPFGPAYVVLGPEGLWNIDVIAHELAHAEHLERVGILSWWLTPAWIREGLAMQVDHRPKYSELALGRALAAGESAPNVTELVSFKQFSRGNLALNYAAARRAVSIICRQLGPEGLSSLVRGRQLETSFTIMLEKAAAQSSGS
jgi:hypothetical protein